ncbi:MAG TPA: hypothetical protein VM431_09710 [Phycisphaerae bacterium]|nr:hypothetical protein [Phycisphaerae bacterium]
MMLAFMVRPTASILLLLVLVVILLVGLAGAAMLILGLVKRWKAVWILGIIAMVVAGMALAIGAVAGALILPWACTVRRDMRPSPAQIGPGGKGIARCSGDYVRSGGGQGSARVAGVEFEVREPGGGGSRSSTSSTSWGLGSESKHEIAMGEVEIVVKQRDGRIDFAVNGAYYGPVREGDRVVIDERRNVTVNGQRRGPQRKS